MSEARRRRHRAARATLRAGIGAVVAMAAVMTAGARADGMDSPPLQCTLHVAPEGVAGRAVPLRMTLRNTGPRALRVLTWRTPFEDLWTAPFVALSFEGRELAYRGPMVKRGAPTGDDYLRLPAGASASAEADLALVFDLSKPGRYTLTPRLRLMDVQPAGSASTGPMAAQALDCPLLQFELRVP
jgi:hypothetical protein